MSNICVVTGGGSGMGLEAARIVGQNQHVILAGRTVSKLEGAIKDLKNSGVEAESFACDTSDPESVKKLAEYAASLGNVKTVINAAGVSPHMTDGEAIFAINAGGTVNVNNAFAEVMGEGSVILNVSSMSGYMLPQDKIPYQIYQLALQDVNAFIGAFSQMLPMVPDEQKTGMAYTMSKNFVQWFTERMAVKLGPKGIRVVSISPGTFATPMGEVEGEEAAGFAKRGALGRVGDPVEIAKMMAFMVSDDCSYLDGVDILYDGGSIASFKIMMENQKQ